MNIESENIYDKIIEAFGKLPDNLNILEEQIDIDLQMEYFKASQEIKKSSEEKILSSNQDLFDKNISLKIKKAILVKLAGIDDIEAYRTIEKYYKKPDRTLKDWSILALRESKMIIESSLLNENQIIISTGLGGKDGKLRYFVVVFSKNNTQLNDLQKKIISSEFEFILSKNNSEVEKIENCNNYSTILCVLPLELAIKEIFISAINECNEYGDFLDNKFIVTNVKLLDSDEIEKYRTKLGKNIA